jgi:hypothetical protein
MRGVNYFSDEKALNATIWLNSPFNKIVVDAVHYLWNVNIKYRSTAS